MEEKWLVKLCVSVGLIALFVAAGLAIYTPEPSAPVAEIIDTCMTVFCVSLFGVVGLLKGQKSGVPSDED